MYSHRAFPILLLAVLGLAACSRDPNVAKQRYVQSGDSYAQKNRFKEASIQYRNALKIDPRYGVAHYKLAITDLKLSPPDVVEAVKELRRAVELTPENRKEHWDAMVKLSEIYLGPLSPHDEPLMQEVEKYYTALLERDPRSFDGLRLHGDYIYVKAGDALKRKSTAEGRALLAQAAEQYRQAGEVKPGDKGIELQLARTATLAGDFPTAERYYRSVLDRDKSDLDAYRELYLILYAYEKRPADAEQLLKDGYQANQKQYQLLNWLAEQYLVQNRRDDMLRVLDQIKSKAGEYDRAYLDVGDFYLRTADNDSAVREYREGLARDPKHKTDYQKRLVEALLRQGKKDEAGQVNSAILNDNPNDNDAKGVAAALLLDKGDLQKALPQLQQVVSSAPNNAVAHYNLGRALAMRNQPDQAMQHFAKAVELQPAYTAARLALAQIQATQGDYDSSLQSATDVLKYDPNNESAHLLEVASLLGQKKYSDSRQVIAAMLKSNPNSSDAYYQLGVVDLSDGKYADAEQSFRKAWQLDPASSRGLMGVVETYAAQKKFDEAMQILETEIAKAPNRPDLNVALGNIAVRAGRWDKAISEFQKAQAAPGINQQTRGEMYLRIGETQRRQGDLQAAIASIQAARQSLPDDPRVLSTLGLVFESAGRWPEAKQAYQAVIKLNPNDGVVLNNLAFGMATHGDNLDEALTLAQRAKQIMPNMPEVSDTLGWIYLKKNLPLNALDILEDLVAKRPDQGTFRYHYGMALYQKGDKGRALQELKRALATTPSTDEQKQIQDLIKRIG
jgi:tetratricopeptide (TPR) repeat protein